MRVILAEDSMLTREGIARLLRDAGIDVLAEVADGDALLREVALTRPDVAITDIRMPPTHTDEGLVAAGRIRQEHPDTGVLVLSQYIEPSYALRLLAEHPEKVGYLLKERVFDVAVLVDALRRITDGETVIDPTIVSRLLGRQRRHDPLAGADRPGARGPRPARRGAVESGDRDPPVSHRPHRRGPHHRSVRQTRTGRGPGRPPQGAGGPDLPQGMSTVAPVNPRSGGSADLGEGLRAEDGPFHRREAALGGVISTSRSWSPATVHPALQKESHGVVRAWLANAARPSLIRPSSTQ